MKPDIIFSNPPYGKPGVDIMHNLMNNQKQAQMSVLGNISMFKKYTDRLAIQLVQVGAYEYGTNKKLPWGVEQAIFLVTTNGYTTVIKNKLNGETGRNINTSEVTAKHSDMEKPTIVEKDSSDLSMCRYNHTRTCVVKPLDNRTVEMAQSGITRYNYNDTRVGVISEHPLCRPGRVYRVFDTPEEAYECALDLVSWTNPTDSHDRCVKWGFITDYQPHYIWDKENYDL